MRYKINPAAFTGVFVLPNDAADKYLKLASGSQLKVLLWFYRTNGMNNDINTLCEATGLSEGDAEDACSFWADCGLLIDDAPVCAAQSVPQEPEPEEKPKKRKVEVKPPPPSYELIRQRMDESAELRDFFNEAQSQLGRMLGIGDMQSLLLLYDFYGLPAEVILMLCGYARSRGKSSNTNYIYSVGVNWCEREIDTFERANEEIARLEAFNGEWGVFVEKTGARLSEPTEAQMRYLNTWLHEWKCSMTMIALAFSKMRENVGGIKFTYMNTILKEWQKKNIRTPEDAEKDDRAFAERMKPTYSSADTPVRKGQTADEKAGIATTQASFDIEKAERDTRTGVPKLRKRK